MDNPFTKRKFLSLPLKQQHKKCAEVLREAYKTKSEELFTTYLEMSAWMDIEPLAFDSKDLSNAYHRHLNSSGTCFKEHNLLPSIKKGDKDTALPPFDIDIYLDQIRSGHNVGSIIRTVEAFSLGELYFSENTPYIDNKKVQDTSMGAEIHVKSHQGFKLKDLRRPIIALETGVDAINIHDFIFPSSFTLVLGNEEFGCSDETLKLADFIVEIPLRGRKNSLNVANAFAIAAAEITRQIKY